METFEQFMHRALHDEHRGYYRQSLSKVGPRGDFSTSATLLPELSQALAAWIRQELRSRRRGDALSVIEIGPGQGDLLLGVLRAFSWWQRRKIRFHCVEVSKPLSQVQQRTLQGYGVQWHQSMSEALQATGGEALIYSNELVDAFPCLVLGFEQGCWQELTVSDKREDGVEGWLKLENTRTERVAAETKSFCPEPRSGQRLEIPLAYREWLQGWLPDWRKGKMVTIDYGNLGEELVRLHRWGTLRCYFKHLRLEGAEIYRRVGQQDITFDVNFSLLLKWGEELGLKNTGLSTQRDFLKAWGVEVSDDGQKEEVHSLFYVLEQGRGFD
jgi:SAM-dependent MidA family methyltransferase